MVYAHIYCIYYVCVCKLHFFASMRKYRDEGTNSSSTSRSKDNNIKESSMRQQMYIERCTSTYVPKVPMYSSGGLMASLYAWLSLHCSPRYRHGIIGVPCAEKKTIGETIQKLKQSCNLHETAQDTSTWTVMRKLMLISFLLSLCSLFHSRI